jgi:hypothetical protein
MESMGGITLKKDSEKNKPPISIKDSKDKSG